MTTRTPLFAHDTLHDVGIQPKSDRLLAAEMAAALRQRPQLRVVKLADGAKDNWTFLSDELPAGEEIIDFYHAA